MALTKRNQIISRYNEQLEAAKEQYKAERGLKNAVGFKQSDDFRRLNKNKRNALYRKRAKDQNEQTARLPKLLSAPNQPIPRQSGEASIGGRLVNYDVQTIFDGNMFWAALSNNNGIADPNDNGILSQFEIEHEIGTNVRATITFLSGETETYRTPLQLERGLLDLMREANKEQDRAKGSYPIISASRIELDTGQVIYSIYAEI